MAQNQGPSWFDKAREALSFYAISVLGHNAETRPHWSKITDGLYLGAMPMQTQFYSWGNHGDKIVAQCNKDERPLKLVISVVEPWELEGKGFLGLSPVSSKYWNSRIISHRICQFKDFGSNIETKSIKDEVDAIHEMIQNGKSCYVHCKAGRGRSVVVIWCYLIEKTDLTAEEAFLLITKTRPHISPSMSQLRLVQQYQQDYLNNKKAITFNASIYAPYLKDFRHLFTWPVLNGYWAGLRAIFSGDLTQFQRMLYRHLQVSPEMNAKDLIGMLPSRSEQRINLLRSSQNPGVYMLRDNKKRTDTHQNHDEKSVNEKDRRSVKRRHSFYV